LKGVSWLSWLYAAIWCLSLEYLVQFIIGMFDIRNDDEDEDDDNNNNNDGDKGYHFILIICNVYK
jgi:hypothetical protein